MELDAKFENELVEIVLFNYMMFYETNKDKVIPGELPPDDILIPGIQDSQLVINDELRNKGIELNPTEIADLHYKILEKAQNSFNEFVENLNDPGLQQRLAEWLQRKK